MTALKSREASKLTYLASMRKPYKGKAEVFTEYDMVAKEPIEQFRNWFETACTTPGIIEANAMCLATATMDGKPSCRMVLMKGYDRKGFKFFTNYGSRKGQELADNSVAALMFYWEPLMRSVRIEGPVFRLSEEESTTYFHKRPRDSQISACVSSQSTVIASRNFMTDEVEKMKKEYADETKDIPKPSYWGGFLVEPHMVEFWQGQTTRLHDRIRFRRPRAEEEPDGILVHQGEEGWMYERLAP